MIRLDHLPAPPPELVESVRECNPDMTMGMRAALEALRKCPHRRRPAGYTPDDPAHRDWRKPLIPAPDVEALLPLGLAYTHPSSPLVVRITVAGLAFAMAVRQ